MNFPNLERAGIIAHCSHGNSLHDFGSVPIIDININIINRLYYFIYLTSSDLVSLIHIDESGSSARFDDHHLCADRCVPSVHDQMESCSPSLTALEFPQLPTVARFID
jgi:hypothetical protein